MKKKQHLVTKSVVALMLNIDVKTVERWEKHETDPLPIAIKGGAGRPHKYDIAAVHSWGIRKQLADLHSVAGGKVYDYEAERARLTHEQADKVTLENAQMRGELIPREVVEATWTEMVSYMRGRFLGMPTKLAPAVQGSDDLAEIRAVLTDGVHEALQEIATNGLPEDAQTRVKLIAENLTKTKTAA